MSGPLSSGTRDPVRDEDREAELARRRGRGDRTLEDADAPGRRITHRDDHRAHRPLPGDDDLPAAALERDRDRAERTLASVAAWERVIRRDGRTAVGAGCAIGFASGAMRLISQVILAKSNVRNSSRNSIQCLRMPRRSKHRRGMPLLRSCLSALLLAAAGALAACTGPQPPAPSALSLAPPPLPAPPAVDPATVPSFVQTGLASWYGADFHNRHTASGERYDMHDLTAAHRTLPLDTVVRVTNLENDRSVLVRINDRGPFARGRVIDVSREAAELLGMTKAGVVPVRIEVFGADQFKTVAQYLSPE